MNQEGPVTSWNLLLLKRKRFRHLMYSFSWSTSYIETLHLLIRCKFSEDPLNEIGGVSANTEWLIILRLHDVFDKLPQRQQLCSDHSIPATIRFPDWEISLLQNTGFNRPNKIFWMSFSRKKIRKVSREKSSDFVDFRSTLRRYYESCSNI